MPDLKINISTAADTRGAQTAEASMRRVGIEAQKSAGLAEKSFDKFSRKFEKRIFGAGVIAGTAFGAVYSAFDALMGRISKDIAEITAMLTPANLKTFIQGVQDGWQGAANKVNALAKASDELAKANGKIADGLREQLGLIDEELARKERVLDAEYDLQRARAEGIEDQEVRARKLAEIDDRRADNLDVLRQRTVADKKRVLERSVQHELDVRNEAFSGIVPVGDAVQLAENMQAAQAAYASGQEKIHNLENVISHKDSFVGRWVLRDLKKLRAVGINPSPWEGITNDMINSSSDELVQQLVGAMDEDEINAEKLRAASTPAADVGYSGGDINEFAAAREKLNDTLYARGVAANERRARLNQQLTGLQAGAATDARVASLEAQTRAVTSGRSIVAGRGAEVRSRLDTQERINQRAADVAAGNLGTSAEAMAEAAQRFNEAAGVIATAADVISRLRAQLHNQRP